MILRSFYKLLVILVCASSCKFSASADGDPEFEKLLLSACGEARRIYLEAEIHRKVALRDYLLVLLSEIPVATNTQTLPELLDNRTAPTVPAAVLSAPLSPQEESRRRECALLVLAADPRAGTSLLPTLIHLATQRALALREDRLQRKLVELLLVIANALNDLPPISLATTYESVVSALNGEEKFYADLVLRESGPQILPTLVDLFNRNTSLRPALADFLRVYLVQLGNYEIADPLLDLLKTALVSKNQTLSLMVLRILKELPLTSRRYIDLLAQACADPSEDLSHEAFEALLKLNSRLKPGILQLSGPSFKLVLEAALRWSGKRREDAFALLETVGAADRGTHDVINQVTQSISETTARAQLLALEGILFGNEKAVYARLIEALLAKDAVMRKAALRALSFIPAQRSQTFRHLAQLFSRRCDAATVAEAEAMEVAINSSIVIAALQRQNPATVVETQPLVSCLWHRYLKLSILQNQVGSEDPRNQSSKLLEEALISIRPALPRILVSELKSRDDLSRSLVVRLLAPLAVRDAALRRQLLNMLQDRSIPVREAAASALADLKLPFEPSLNKMIDKYSIPEIGPILEVFAAQAPDNPRFQNKLDNWLKVASCDELAKRFPVFNSRVYPKLQQALLKCLENPAGVRSDKMAEHLVDASPLGSGEQQRLLQILNEGKLSAHSSLQLVSEFSKLGFKDDQRLQALLDFISRSEGQMQLQGIKLMLKLNENPHLTKSQLDNLRSKISELDSQAAFLILAARSGDRIEDLTPLHKLLKADQAEAQRLFGYLPWNLAIEVAEPRLLAPRESEIGLGLLALQYAAKNANSLPARVVALADDPRLVLRAMATATLIEVSETLPSYRNQAISALRNLLLEPEGQAEYDGDSTKLVAALRTVMTSDSSQAVRGLAKNWLCNLKPEECS